MINLVKLIVKTKPRYWEDFTINGIEDELGRNVPLKQGEKWNISIDLNKGKIIDWPEGTTANIYTKICDGGEYWLENEKGSLFKYKNDYVPEILDLKDEGYGDYIIMDINENGYINNWSLKLKLNEWE